ncbi:MAG: 16S rRNA (guanine(527)-N(7))-methyltransferase RsmG [Bacteroidales bacterium]|nr:16S rRNA (guanine(527)-N(7))-methyltransferase RsmG [Bacteroidales bacterium]
MDVIEKYYPHLTALQKDKLEQLVPLFQEWNIKVNLVSRKDIEYLKVRHVLHSLSVAKFFEFRNSTHILDVGTGGGFPGIPLAIVFPNVHFHLVDSTGKKIKIVNILAKELELNNVKAEQIRGEELGGRYDFITSRAVTKLPLFFSWVKNKIKQEDSHEFPNGILYLKGGDFEEELKQIPWKHELYYLDKWFDESFFKTKKLVYLYPAHKQRI